MASKDVVVRYFEMGDPQMQAAIDEILYLGYDLHTVVPVISEGTTEGYQVFLVKPFPSD